MKAYGVTVQQMEQALEETNKEFGDNVEFKRFDTFTTRAGVGINFTLKVKNSSGPGARRSCWDRHKLISACWHVHGSFFDNLFKIAPYAKVISTFYGRREITKDDGNWEDSDIGSRMKPCLASEACECE